MKSKYSIQKNPLHRSEEGFSGQIFHGIPVLADGQTKYAIPEKEWTTAHEKSFLDEAAMPGRYLSHRRRAVQSHRNSVAGLYPLVHVHRGRAVLSAHRLHSDRPGEVGTVPPLPALLRRRDGRGVFQRLPVQSQVAHERLGLQRVPAQYYGPGVPAVFRAVGAAEHRGYSAVPLLFFLAGDGADPPPSGEGARLTLEGQASCKGQAPQRGERAEHTSRPNRTRR